MTGPRDTSNNDTDAYRTLRELGAIGAMRLSLVALASGASGVACRVELPAPDAELDALYAGDWRNLTLADVPQITTLRHAVVTRLGSGRRYTAVLEAFDLQATLEARLAERGRLSESEALAAAREHGTLDGPRLLIGPADAQID